MFGILFTLFSCQSDVPIDASRDVTNPPGSTCFENSNFGCSPSSIQLKEYILNNVIGYPGCTFRVEVKLCVQYLNNPTATIVTMGDYRLVTYSCPQFSDSLDLYYATPSEADDNAFFRRLDEAIFTRLENFVFADFATNVSCVPSSISGTFTTVAIREACSSICYYAYEETKDGGNGMRAVPKPSSFVRTQCSTDGCCLRETKICYNAETDKLEKSTTSTVFPGSISPQTACAGGTIDPPALPNGTYLLKCNACSFACQ